MINILSINYDEKKDELIFQVPEVAVPIYLFKRNKIAKLLFELSTLTKENKFPSFKYYIQRECRHIYPKEDIIQHTTTHELLDVCSCSPTLDIINKIVYHNAMDPQISGHKEDPKQWLDESFFKNEGGNVEEEKS
jgi:hypothetical protein